MTLYEFNSLSEHDKYDHVFTKGEFIDYKLKMEKHFALYAIDKFFVEIEYDKINNKIIGLKSFKTGELLDKYSNLKF
tara:strand:+ start:2723 stop:2953 length:231 start_codon:yes stop_codon:yes gene_type:complete